MMRGMRTVLLAALALFLSACASSRVIPERGAARPPPRVSAPKYGAVHVVQRGETLYRIAVNHGISPLDLAMWNRIPPPYVIYPGQRLRLYPGAPGRAVTPPPATPSAPARPPAATPRPTPPPVSAIVWQWPADGPLLNRFVPGDVTRQGIDIAGKSGDPVRAAADGVVVYSGAGLVGYGELIIVKHNDEWLSAYGHNRARLVNEGQVVKAGQQIAELGRTGAAREMLHFEIRHNGKPVDPLRYLPSR